MILFSVHIYCKFMGEEFKRECGRIRPQLCSPVRYCTAVIFSYMPGIQQSILSLALVRPPNYRCSTIVNVMFQNIWLLVVNRLLYRVSQVDEAVMNK